MKSTKTKNKHAVAMGRKGGQSRSPAKLAALRKNALKGGRPLAHRIVALTPPERIVKGPPGLHLEEVQVEHYSERVFTPVRSITPRHLDIVAKWMRENRDGWWVVGVEDGVITIGQEA